MGSSARVCTLAPFAARPFGFMICLHSACCSSTFKSGFCSALHASHVQVVHAHLLGGAQRLALTPLM